MNLDTSVTQIIYAFGLLSDEDEFKRNFWLYDCFVYIMDAKFYLKNDLIGLLGHIAPHQILIITVMTDGSSGANNDMDVLSQFRESFGDFKNCPLATTTVKWRLRCYK
ncbi:hypothetical protein TSMEX_008975 [Taenia solium]|eukprot:TsM_000984700 transcript=TsM_000984700 gene=TsM_000984700